MNNNNRLFYFVEVKYAYGWTNSFQLFAEGMARLDDY